MMNRRNYRIADQQRLAAGGFYQGRAEYHRRSDWVRTWTHQEEQR